MMHYDDARGERPRLLVVANRLPVSAKRTGENSWSLEMSPGGLVSGLLGKSLMRHTIIIITIIIIKSNNVLLV